MNDCDIIEKNKAFYQAYAPYYDRGRSEFFRHETQRIQKDISFINSKRDVSKAKLLDVGSGTGFYSLLAASTGIKNIHCLDLDEQFLNLTRTKFRTQYPETKLTCHNNDMRSFIDQYSHDALRNFDIFFFGSVLHYVPNHEELLQKIINVAPKSIYYLSSIPLTLGSTQSFFQSAFLRVDYLFHRLLKQPPPLVRHVPDQATVNVNIETLADLFMQNSFEIYTYNYTTFHSSVFNVITKPIKNIFPSIGTHSTLIATPKE